MSQDPTGLKREVLEELSAAAMGRASGWRCIGLGFSEPTPEIVQFEYLEALEDGMAWLFSGHERFQASFQALSDFHGGKAGRDAQEMLQELKGEYQRLLSGPGALIAPPREALYRTGGDNGSPSPEATVEAVAEFYEMSDFRPSPGYEDSPDHLVAECDFIRSLCQQEAEAWLRSDDEAAKEYRIHAHHFINEHVAHWLPDFCNRVKADTRSKFYWGLAEYCLHFLSIETGGEFVTFNVDVTFDD